jgi:hypothetical protein
MTSEIEDIEAALGARLPNQFLGHLAQQPEELRADGLLLYPISYLVERNRTYEVQQYAPGFLLIGDDSGGDGFLIRFDEGAGTEVFRTDLGSLTEEDFELVAGSLDEWAAGSYCI